MTTIDTLTRNDVQGAVSAYRELRRSGTWAPHYSQHLLMMQDDPDELIDAIAAAEVELVREGVPPRETRTGG